MRKLDCGDYGAVFEDGTVSNVVFERKSIPDVLATMTSGYEKFKKEMERATSSNTIIILVIEGCRAKVKKGHKFTKVRGISIIKKLNTLRLRYGLEFWYCRDRKEMGDRITDWYIAEEQELLRVKKGLK